MKINVGATEIIEIIAKQENGGNILLEVEDNECYDFFVPPTERWTDFYFIRCGADGFWYPLFRNKLREKSVRYFVLCGLSRISNATFPIGSQLKSWKPQIHDEIAFIANDVPGHYNNNRGSIQLHITRIQ